MVMGMSSTSSFLFQEDLLQESLAPGTVSGNSIANSFWEDLWVVPPCSQEGLVHADSIFLPPGHSVAL